MTGSPARTVVAVNRCRAIGTDVVVAVTRPETAVEADACARDELDALDLACSRFRHDSEICAVQRNAGRWVEVGDVLWETLCVAIASAHETDGTVDPTIGSAVAALGYDRDFALLEEDSRLPHAQPSPGPQTIELDATRRRVRIAPGVSVDLGATAKAWAADRVAGRIAALGTGALVSLGGDVACAGPAPEGGWPVGIGLDSQGPAQQVISLRVGAVASSAPGIRTWARGGKNLHHIVDPRTGESAEPYWQLVSVAAPSCARANTWSTASIVWGPDAPARLSAAMLAARLVHVDGTVTTTPGWPA
ncbi:MAG: FAD:protein FMN transferase [Acidimicrobiales bacterium]